MMQAFFPLILKREWTSKRLFSEGSILYVWIAIWDIRAERNWDDDDDELSAFSRLVVPPALRASVGAEQTRRIP